MTHIEIGFAVLRFSGSDALVEVGRPSAPTSAPGPHTIRQIALIAEVHSQTVERYFDGRAMRRATRARVERAAAVVGAR